MCDCSYIAISTHLFLLWLYNATNTRIQDHPWDTNKILEAKRLLINDDRLLILCFVKYKYTNDDDPPVFSATAMDACYNSMICLHVHRLFTCSSSPTICMKNKSIHLVVFVFIIHIYTCCNNYLLHLENLSHLNCLQACNQVSFCFWEKKNTHTHNHHQQHYATVNFHSNCVVLAVLG